MGDKSAPVPPSVEILRATLGDLPIDMTREKLRLSERIPSYDMKAQKLFMMLYCARSGSTYAAQLLSAHRDFNRMTEWFWPKRLEELRERFGTETHNETIARILKQRKRPVFAGKTMQQSLISAAYLGLLDRYRNRIFFILYERRDKVAQAVSFLKARISGQFHSSQDADRKVTRDDYDFDTLADFYRRVHRLAIEHERSVAALGKSARHYYYEDVREDPGAFVTDISTYLNVDLPKSLTKHTQVQPLADDINREWADRFREEWDRRGETLDAI